CDRRGDERDDPAWRKPRRDDVRTRGGAARDQTRERPGAEARGSRRGEEDHSEEDSGQGWHEGKCEGKCEGRRPGAFGRREEGRRDAQGERCGTRGRERHWSARGVAMPGIFISFEGGDGAGKTTQAELLASYLATRGLEVVRTRDPGGTELGTSIRNLLLHGGHVDERAEALLYAADRAHTIAEVVRPALERGAAVVHDRYIDSSLAYQGAGRTLAPDEIRSLNEWATQGLWPQLTVLLDVKPELAASRRSAAGQEADRLEREAEEFHTR